MNFNDLIPSNQNKKYENWVSVEKNAFSEFLLHLKKLRVLSIRPATNEDVEEALSLPTTSVYGIHTHPSKNGDLEYRLRFVNSANYGSYKSPLFVVKTETKNDICNVADELLVCFDYSTSKSRKTDFSCMCDLATLKVNVKYDTYKILKNIQNMLVTQRENKYTRQSQGII